MFDFIKTKLLFEYKPGQLIGLGYGNIINSEADFLIISSFETQVFVPKSSIGCLSQYLKESENIDLEELVTEDLGRQGYQVLDFSSYNLRFKKVLLISMGPLGYTNSENQEFFASRIINHLKNGLDQARIFLSKESAPFTINITALGTTYGGLRRKESFDMLINWAADLFNATNKVSLLRFIAYDIDTFVDFFESVFRLQKIKPENELSFSANYNSDHFTQFKGELNSALRSLDDNPRGVIITCRSIIENIVKSKIPDSSVKLVDGIFLLKDSTPPSIYSYLTTCRLLGNFSNHDPNFIPTRRDAEGILLLTLRIVEWHLANESNLS